MWQTRSAVDSVELCRKDKWSLLLICNFYVNLELLQNEINKLRKYSVFIMKMFELGFT